MLRAGLVLGALLLLAGGRADAAAMLSFERAAVNVTGMKAQGKVFLFGVVWTDIPRSASRHTTFLSDGDGDGQARLDLGSEMTPISVWFAVDFEDGGVTIASRGTDVREMPFPWNAIPSGRGALAFPSERVYVALVRPKTGAWIARGHDGKDLDADGNNDGALRMDLASFSGFGGSPPPPRTLEPGDVILMVDAERLLFTTHEVGD
jgi:hypothetical protein